MTNTNTNYNLSLIEYIADKNTEADETEIDSIIEAVTFGNEELAQDILKNILDCAVNNVSLSLGTTNLENILIDAMKNWKKSTPIDDQINYIADYCELVPETFSMGTSKKRIVVPHEISLIANMCEAEKAIAEELRMESLLNQEDDYEGSIMDVDTYSDIRVVAPIDSERVLSGEEFETITGAEAEDFLENYPDIAVFGVTHKDGSWEKVPLTYASECAKFIKFVCCETATV